MISLCVPTIKRYDLLKGMLASVVRGNSLPKNVLIIDNGRMLKPSHLVEGLDYRVHTPEAPMGIAESWNWFIDHTTGARLIVNDDVVFARGSFTLLMRSNADLTWAAECGFSCFLIRDTCIEKIGRFDETISPGYGYYEDEDYLQRLDGRGTRPPSAIAATVDCGVRHLQSQTLKQATKEEYEEHHRKFKIAQANYMRKWGLTSL